MRDLGDIIITNFGLSEIMDRQKPKRISIVLATWCPHCVPLSLEYTKKMSEELEVPYRVLDIDQEDQCRIGDDLVKNYGDDCADYLIPQVFFENPDGSVAHVFTGFSETTDATKKHWDDFFQSDFYSGVKR